MELSREDLELIDKVTSGELSPNDLSFIHLFDCYDDDVYKRILSNPSLTEETRLAVDMAIIDKYSQDCWQANDIWDFLGGSLRHCLVAHWFSDPSKWKPLFEERLSTQANENRFLLDDVFHYLANEYVPANGEPSANDIRMELINEYVYKENHIVECLKRGYLDWLDWRQRDDLVQWCKEQPEKMEEYINAGLWRFLSVHERASRIAERLDKAAEGIQAYSELIEYLQMEESSPLKEETSDIVKELSLWLKSLPYENDLQ